MVTNKKIVAFAYRLKDADGKLIESRDAKDPQIYLHGSRNILSALERHMNGKIPGDSFTITLEPREAHGLRKPNAEQRIPVKHLQGAKKWKPGMTGIVHTDKGHHQVTVTKVGKFMVVIDTNHPLAGKQLTYDIDILNVREATPAELAHGHAHGLEGHDHHG